MNPTLQPIVSPRHVIHLLVSHPKRWLLPAVVIGLLAGAYALVRPATWEASQALIIRNEAANKEGTPGKFSHSDERKTVQETILELSRSRGVLAAALGEVGPPSGNKKDAGWPSAAAIADLREAMKLTPPKGAEFGTTEIFYLKVRDRSPERAIALAHAVVGQVENRFRQLRQAKAQSMIDEMAKTINLAKADLDEATTRLTESEKSVGADLAELRTLNDSSAGESGLHQIITQVWAELRQSCVAKQDNEELLAVLGSAQEDPGRLLATPNRLLESQPALRRLKEGLVDAQLRTAQLSGRMSKEHPTVRAAIEAEEGISRHLHDELDIAVRGIKVDLRLNTDRVKLLQEQLATAKARLDRLAGIRATYSNQVAEAQHRTELLERATENLSEARASQASANSASLISRIDVPDTGNDSVGLGRGTILLVGIVGGLLVGFGWLAITVEPLHSAAAPFSSNGHPVAAGRMSTPRHDRSRVATEKAADSAEETPGRGLSLKEALLRISHSQPNVNGGAFRSRQAV